LDYILFIKEANVKILSLKNPLLRNCIRQSLSIALVLAVMACISSSNLAIPSAAVFAETTPKKNSYSEPLPMEQAFDLPVVVSAPRMNEVKVRKNLPYLPQSSKSLKMDLYYPPDLKSDEVLPVVLLIHGGPVPSGIQEHLFFTSWCRMIAASSRMIGVAFWWRTPDISDVRAAVAYLQQNAATLQVNKDRIGAIAFSSGVEPFMSGVVSGKLEGIKCAAGYYGRYSQPRKELKKQASRIPVSILVVKAGRDEMMAGDDSERFVEEAKAKGINVDLLIHATGSHCFDVRNRDDRSVEIVVQTVKFLLQHLN
jgi:acetyl esterase/lipase